MSEKLTRIRLAGLPHGEGFMDWGERSVEDMITIMRLKAVRMRQLADLIDAAADEDFQIDVIRGSVVQHHLKTLQPGRSE